MVGTAGRAALETALAGYASGGHDEDARSFLDGLSEDELRFLAEFLGACFRNQSIANTETWDVVCHREHALRQRLSVAAKSGDGDHEWALVREFASRCGFLIHLL